MKQRLRAFLVACVVLVPGAGLALAGGAAATTPVACHLYGFGVTMTGGALASATYTTGGPYGANQYDTVPTLSIAGHMACDGGAPYAELDAAAASSVDVSAARAVQRCESVQTDGGTGLTHCTAWAASAGGGYDDLGTGAVRAFGACWTAGGVALPASFVDEGAGRTCQYNLFGEGAGWPPDAGQVVTYLSGTWADGPHDGTADGTAPVGDPTLAALSTAQDRFASYVASGIGVIIGLLLLGIGLAVLVKYLRKAGALSDLGAGFDEQGNDLSSFEAWSATWDGSVTE